jgi:hypothetical protein
MAMYHLSVKIIGRSSGRSSVAAAAYRAGERITNERDGLTHDYTHRRDTLNAVAYRSGGRYEFEGETYDFTNKKGVVHSEIILPENSPEEFADRATLWNAVERAEKRHDSQLAREVEISLPKELNLEQQVELTREYIKENFVNKGMIADFSIHHSGHEHSEPNEFQDEPIKPYNPHAHIMLTMRDVESDGFKLKNRSWNGKAQVEKWREGWANTANKHLELAGFEERIDHRTLLEQGITDREPMKYMGRGYAHIRAKGQETTDLKHFVEVINPVNGQMTLADMRYLNRSGRFDVTNKQLENTESHAEIRTIEKRITQLERHKRKLTELREQRANLQELRPATEGARREMLDFEYQRLGVRMSYEIEEVERKMAFFDSHPPQIPIELERDEPFRTVGISEEQMETIRARNEDIRIRRHEWEIERDMGLSR